MLIGICILAGYMARKYAALPSGSHKAINFWLINLAIPAVALKYIPTIQWSYDLLLAAGMPVIVWAGSWAVCKLYARLSGIDDATRIALTLTAGLGNTSFLGFPLIQGYYGDQAMSTAIISDQVTFMLMSTVGAITAMHTAHKGEIDAGQMVKKVLFFPPFMAFVAAMLLPMFVDISAANTLFDKLAVTLTPLALFSVGLQLEIAGWQNELKPMLVGLGYKLFIAPAVILLIVIASRASGQVAQISVFEAAMAPMVTAGVLAMQYELNPKLANRMVGIGILLSLITSALWWWILQAWA